MTHANKQIYFLEKNKIFTVTVNNQFKFTKMSKNYQLNAFN